MTRTALHPHPRRLPAMRRVQLTVLAAALSSCGPGDDGVVEPPAVDPVAMTVLGTGPLTARYTAEVWAAGGLAYTATWGNRFAGGVATPGNMVFVWDVAGATPQLVDSVTVPGATTVGDVEVTDDGRHLVVCTEPGPGSMVVFDLADRRRPVLLSVFTSPNITRGVHTAEVERVNGRQYAFLTANTGVNQPSHVVIVDLTDPALPVEVKAIDVTGTFNHDVFVRDGILFTAQWNNGLVIFDIGGGGRGGSPSNPVRIGAVLTVGGKVHNVWWFHDPSSGRRQYAFVGEEGPASLFTSSSGDLHVVDVTDLANPREVAFFSVPGAGPHNFSMDEASGLLYAAYYNGGVQVLDVRGDLSGCTAAEKAPDGRCDLRAMKRLRGVGLLDRGIPVFVWGVHVSGGAVYASDMANGLWKLGLVAR